MDAILILLLGGVAGFFLPWWVLLVLLLVLVNLYLTYRGSDSDSAYIKLMYGVAVFVGFVIGCLISVLTHSHFVLSLHRI
jgi:hypothetical protein